MKMIKHHPTQQQLETFSEGNLSEGVLLMLSAHCELCPKCQAKVDEHIAATAEGEMEDAKDAEMTPSLLSMMNEIMAQPAELAINVEKDAYIDLEGRKFTIPFALKSIAKRCGNWSRLIGRLWQAQVDLGDGFKGYFIYMEKGGKVPEHTHNGAEMTLVLDGVFKDENGQYADGDFVVTDESVTHTPNSEVEEGCLVFSIVEKPLHFTSGLARLLNPISHLFFK